MVAELKKIFANPLTELKDATAADTFDTDAFKKGVAEIDGIELIG